MRLNEVTRALAAGAVIYVVMAACGSSGGQKSPGATASNEPDASAQGGMEGVGAAATGEAGATGTGGLMGEIDAMVDDVIDAMTDPVPDAAADPATSGDRLRARYLNGADGSRHFVGWRDTERDEDCSFKRAEDGQMRCLPDTPALFTSYFSDTGCEQPLALTFAAYACQGPLYAYKATSGCSFNDYTYEIYSATPTAPATVYSGTPQNCIASPSVPETYVYYSVQKVAASSFVAATEEVE